MQTEKKKNTSKKQLEYNAFNFKDSRKLVIQSVFL